MLEIDVHLTKDQHFVVIHGETMMNGWQGRIADYIIAIKII